MSRLTRITLRLARNPEAGFPDGDPHRGYTIVAPLDADGCLDVVAWHVHRQRCKVVRFSPDPDEQADGWLTHRGAQWSIHYDESDEGPDEPLFRLGVHRFAVGEYLSILERDGATLAYRVADLNPA
jgi:hypothetical protein